MLQYRRYRAPQRHGEKFFDPPLTEAPHAVAENIQRRRSWSVQLQGHDLASVAAEGRHELCRLALSYSRQYLNLASDLLDPSSDVPLILSGHQPQLFHVGVWFKNFFIDRLAKEVQGLAINLIVDNDLGGMASIRVPGGSVSHPGLETVAYDRPIAEIPFEERGLVDREQFESFSDRVHEIIAPLVQHPLLDSWWPQVVEASRHESNLGRCIARARHQLEVQWGSSVLDVPLSRVCDTRAFRIFLLHMFSDIVRFQAIYNDSLLEYRRVNRVRSRSHPVPQLERIADWWEAPLWVWTNHDPQRRRLYVRFSADDMELTDLKLWRSTLRRKSEDALDNLAQLSHDGVRIRPRALVTTMYSRLMLCDYFVHGIGGGKYDQLTDAIWQRWLGIEPLRFQVATATAQLPVTRPSVSSHDLRNIERTLRELRFNPDRHLVEDGPASALIAEKRRWLAVDAVNRNGRERHAALARINTALQPFVQKNRAQLETERERLEILLRHDRILGSREFAFCLLPEQTLRVLLLDNG